MILLFFENTRLLLEEKLSAKQTDEV